MLKNQQILNGRTDFLVIIIEFLCFLNDTQLLEESPGKIDRTILTCLF